MFSKIKKIFEESRSGIMMITYGLLLYFILLNLKAVFDVIGSFFGLIRPLFLGLGMAYVLNLPMARIEKLLKKHCKQGSWIDRKSRGLAITLTLILAVILIIILFSVIVPQLIGSLILLFSNVGNYIDNIVNFFIGLMDNLHLDNEFIREQLNELSNLPWDKIFSNIISWLGNASSSLGTVASDMVTKTINFVGELGIWLTGFMVSLYLLSSKEQFVYQARKLTIGIFGQKLAQPCFYWGHIINETFANFIGGQLVEAFILFLLYYVSMTIMRMPYALLISVLIGITSIIPVFGAMMGSAIGCILILAINPLQAVGFYIFYQLLQQFENNVIYPRVVGNSVGLPGVWVLISILAFGSVLGVLGMFIAVPASAVIYQAIRAFSNFCIRKRNLQLDQDGFVKTAEAEEESEN